MKLILTSVLLFMTFHLSGQDCNDLEGKWFNELGSVLVIDSIGDDGDIIGKYASSTGVDGKVFPLLGWVNSSDDNPEEVNVGFTVRWKGYGSITSWTGYCYSDNGVPKIKTIWNLVRSGKEFNWERVITNSSTFVAHE